MLERGELDDVTTPTPPLLDTVAVDVENAHGNEDRRLTQTLGTQQVNRVGLPEIFRCNDLQLLENFLKSGSGHEIRAPDCLYHLPLGIAEFVRDIEGPVVHFISERLANTLLNC